MPTLILNPADRAVYEVPAEILATLAFPGTADGNKREGAWDRLCAYVLRLAHDQSHPNLDLRLARERHVILADGTISLGKRIEQRLMAVQRAAAIATPQIAAHLGTEMVVAGVERASHRGLVEFAVASDWYADRSDFRDRAWRPTLPVLHMALALQVVMLRPPQPGMAADHIQLFLQHDLVRQAVELAEPLESVVRELWGEQFDAENQWHFRLVG